MKANLDRTVEIKEKEAHCYHTRMRRIKINPVDPTHPIVIEWIKSWRYEDFKKYFLDPQPERQIQFLKAMNLDSAVVVHDPTIESPPPTPVPGPETIKRAMPPKPNKGGRRR